MDQELHPASRSQGGNQGVPYLSENLWGYGKRLSFIDSTLLRALPDRRRPDVTVLDIGCGNGSQLSIPLANAGYQVTAVDPHKPSIERGRGWSSAVQFHLGKVTDLAPRTFDCVILSEVLEHLDDPDALLGDAMPYLDPSGILIITVPNGYGEFELDRRVYQAMNMDKLVRWLHTRFKRDQQRALFAGSDDQSPHPQRFTLARLQQIFVHHGLLLLASRGMCVASGPFIAHTLGKSERFIRLNAALADHLPLALTAGWMFALRRQHSVAVSGVVQRTRPADFDGRIKNTQT